MRKLNEILSEMTRHNNRRVVWFGNVVLDGNGERVVKRFLKHPNIKLRKYAEELFDLIDELPKPTSVEPKDTGNSSPSPVRNSNVKAKTTSPANISSSRSNAGTSSPSPNGASGPIKAGTPQEGGEATLAKNPVIKTG